MRRQRKSDARAELLPKGTLFFSWKTQGWALREATSSTSDQNQVFCLKTAPGLGVVLAAGRDGQVSLEGEEYLAQRGISAAQQLLESQPGMSWTDVSHQSPPRTPSSVHSVHMELVIPFSRTLAGSPGSHLPCFAAKCSGLGERAPWALPALPGCAFGNAGCSPWLDPCCCWQLCLPGMGTSLSLPVRGGKMSLPPFPILPFPFSLSLPPFPFLPFPLSLSLPPFLLPRCHLSTFPSEGSRCFWHCLGVKGEAG